MKKMTLKRLAVMAGHRAQQLPAFATSNAGKMVLMGAAVITAATMAPDTFAGAGGTEFDPIWTTITDWTQGTLGKVITGALILVGIIGGVARQSLIAFAIGIGGGIGLYNTPTIIDNVVSSTLANVPAASSAITTITNSLGG